MCIIYYSLMKPSNMMSFPPVDFLVKDVAYSVPIPSINRILKIISNIGYRMTIAFI